MASGKVKWFNTEKGFGFIVDDSGRDIFVHYSSILDQGYKVLQQGENVTFELNDGDKGLKAQNVKRQS
jgi:cold shock protein